MTLLKSSRSMPAVIDRFFSEDFLNNFFERPMSLLDKTGSYGRVNMIDNKDNYQLEVALPGATKNDVRVTKSGDRLTIESSTTTDKNTEEKNYVRQEFSSSSFKRSFELPANTTDDTIDAKFQNGILTITVAKVEPEPTIEATKIEIS